MWELPVLGKLLGSGSEVDGFRVKVGHGAFIERLAKGETPHFGDQFLIRMAFGGSYPDKDAGRRFRPEIVRTIRTGIDPYRQ